MGDYSKACKTELKDIYEEKKINEANHSYVYDLEDLRVQYLIRTNDKLGRLIKFIGTCKLSIEKDGFRCLVKYIIGQQISDKARETIWKRLCLKVENLNPELILEIDEIDLYKVGLPRNKINYIKTLAESIKEGKIDFQIYPTFTNEEIINDLTKIKGIGQWTAEMYLIFSLGRMNVLSKTDGTIRRAIKWMYNLEELPSAKMLSEYFIHWTEYATIVSSFFWRSIELGLQLNSFEDIVFRDEESSDTTSPIDWMKFSILISKDTIFRGLRVGVILVSKDNNFLCSSFSGESNNTSWLEVLLLKLQKLQVFYTHSIYITINTLSEEDTFDLTGLFNYIELEKVYIGLPDPQLEHHILGDPIDRNDVFQYPDMLQREIIMLNNTFFGQSNQSIRRNTYYLNNKISDMVIDYLKSHGYTVSKEELNKKREITCIAQILCNNYTITYEKSVAVVRGAVSESFNRKYGNYNYLNDVRSLTSRWKEDFISLCKKLQLDSISNINIINVGVGNGDEAAELFYNCSNITLVDIAETGLKRAHDKFSFMKTIVASAENLSSISENNYDLYVSLRTYNSSFFNITEALSEAHRILKPGGSIIISIANGFLCFEHNCIIPGLIIPDTEFVDIYRCIKIAKTLKEQLYLAKFSNVQITFGDTEIFLSAIAE